jgi:tryptophan synthase beta chain
MVNFDGLGHSGAIHSKDQSIIVNLSGRGDKDIHTVAAIDGMKV